MLYAGKVFNVNFVPKMRKSYIVYDSLFPRGFMLLFVRLVRLPHL